MLNSFLQDPTFLQLFLWITSTLFLLSIGRIVSLMRANRRLGRDNERMENWAVTQQGELVSIHHDAQSWRAKTQRQFDAIRADLSVRLEQADRAAKHSQNQADEAMDRALAAARTRINELEVRLQTLSETGDEPIPALPAMETLRAESLETELAALKAEVCEQQRQNAELQRALLLARRRKHAVPRQPARSRQS